MNLDLATITREDQDEFEDLLWSVYQRLRRNTNDFLGRRLTVYADIRFTRNRHVLSPRAIRHLLFIETFGITWRPKWVYSRDVIIEAEFF